MPSGLLGRLVWAALLTPAVLPGQLEARKPGRGPVWMSSFWTLLEDHKTIWTGPAHLQRRNLPWLLPLAGATAATIRFDARISRSLPNSPDQIRFGRAVSRAGAHDALAGIAGSFYVAGRLTGNRRARETGLIAAQAVLHTHAVAQALKYAAGRERPDYGDGQGRFWRRQQSFPSGHSAGSWAVAAVISREYSDRRAVRYGIYVLPVAVSAARIGAHRHYVSDLIAGAVIGHLIGSYLYDRHHHPEPGRPADRPRSRAWPSPEFHCSAAGRTCGVSLAWGL